jgi:hypothetical protein
MSRRSSLQQSSARSSLITPRIIEGRYARAHYPGTAIFAENCRELASAYRLSRGRPKLLPAARLFGAVERYSRILHQLRHDQHKVVPYLIDVAGHSEAWVCAPEEFRPRTTHGRDQITELVRYLFEAYRPPGWLRAAAHTGRGRPGQAPAFGWYVHVARGQSLRTAPALPVPLSRKAAHLALSAPARSTPEQALLHGYLSGHGASRAVREEVLRSVRWHGLELDEHWLKLFEKIARAQDLPADQVRALLAHADARRERGASIDVSVATLLRGLERQRAAQVRQQAQAWGPQFDEPWAASLPAAPFTGSSDGGEYALHELRSLREIFEEGQSMHHRVFTYAQAARAGTVSIWSLRLARAGREVGRVTLRVVASERAVVEARRRCNQAIFPQERELIRSWASRQGLSLSVGV